MTSNFTQHFGKNALLYGYISKKNSYIYYIIE